ncbi:MAG: hypothetical protein CUN55_18050, partial [Phototrophicales bacterium]
MGKKLDQIPESVVLDGIGAPRREAIVKGYIVDYYCDDAIVLTYVHDTTREVADAFVASSNAYVNACKSAGRPLFYGLIVGAFMLSPYMQQRNKEVIEIIKEMHGRGAYVFEPSPFRIVMQNSALVYNRKILSHIDIQPFKSAEEALRWLYEGYTEWQAQ